MNTTSLIRLIAPRDRVPSVEWMARTCSEAHSAPAKAIYEYVTAAFVDLKQPFPAFRGGNAEAPPAYVTREGDSSARMDFASRTHGDYIPVFRGGGGGLHTTRALQRLPFISQVERLGLC